MRVTLALAALCLIGCRAYAAESDPIIGPGPVGDVSINPQSPGYMLAFPMDEAGMVAAESDPVPQLATIIKEEEAPVAPGNTVSVTSTPETKPIIKSSFQQPSEADRRRKIEEMRKILGLPAIGQKPKPVPFEKPKPMFLPTLMKVLPRLDNSPLSSLPLALIRRSDEEGPKMLHGLLRQAATVFMRRALFEDEPDVQDVSENKGKKDKDSLFYLLDDDKEDAKEDEKKGGKDDDDDDDDDIAFIPLPRPMLPIPQFRGGLPTPNFGLPRRLPQMMQRRPLSPRPFPPMGQPSQAHRMVSRPPTPFQPQPPTQPMMLMLHPFMVPQPMMVPQPSMMQPMLAPHPGMPHPMMFPPPPPHPFHPHPFMVPHHPMMMPQHPMMMPQHPPFLMDPHMPHPHLIPPQLPPQHPMMFPHQFDQSAPQPVIIRPVIVPEYRPVPVPIEAPEESEESPVMFVYDDAQPRFHHQHHQAQQQAPQFQAQAQSQINARSMPAILSSLRRMQMLRELIMARSLQQMSPRALFHSPVPSRVPQGEREGAQSIFRPIFMPMG